MMALELVPATVSWIKYFLACLIGGSAPFCPIIGDFAPPIQQICCSVVLGIQLRRLPSVRHNPIRDGLLPPGDSKPLWHVRIKGPLVWTWACVSGYDCRSLPFPSLYFLPLIYLLLGLFTAVAEKLPEKSSMVSLRVLFQSAHPFVRLSFAGVQSTPSYDLPQQSPPLLFFFIIRENGTTWKSGRNSGLTF